MKTFSFIKLILIKKKKKIFYFSYFVLKGDAGNPAPL